jgi:hypothetical protein
MTSIPGYFKNYKFLIGIFLLEVLIKAIGIMTNISATPPLPLTDGFHS